METRARLDPEYGAEWIEVGGTYSANAFTQNSAISTRVISMDEVDVWARTSAGASTIPEGRNRGAQHALLGARLKYAAGKGCALAMMGASPGGQSQRNAEKNDFKIA